VFNNLFFSKSCRLWDNVENTVESDRPQMTVCCVERWGFASHITKARTQTHPHNILCLLLHNWLFPCDVVQYVRQHLKKLRNCATTYLSLLSVSQTVRLNKAISKRTFFCFNTSSGTVYADILTFYCCRRHEFAIKSLLCITYYFYIVDMDV
jgi:hypothetical protein